MKKKCIKVLQLRSSIGYFGAENVIVELSQQLQLYGVISYVAVIENRHPNSKELVYRARDLMLPTEIFQGASPFSLKAMLQMKKFVRKNKIDIIHSHDCKANFYAYLYKHLDNNLPCIATLHPWTESDYSLRAKAYAILDKKILRRFDFLVPVAENERQIVEKINYKKTQLISNGIEVKKFSGTGSSDLRSKLGLGKHDRIITTIGRLVPEKGLQYLLEAVQILTKTTNDFSLLIVGDGPLKANLQQMVNDANLKDKVVFAGIRNDIAEILVATDLFVLSSISEGMPMVVLEAMAAGKPVVATSVGDIPKLIKHQKTGLLVPPRSPQLLANAMATMLSNEVLSRGLAEAAKNFVANNYTSDIMAKKYCDVYHLVMDAG